MSDDFVYLVRDDDPDHAAGPGGGRTPSRPPLPRRRRFVGSARYFAAWVVGGVVLGLLAEWALSAARGDRGLVWTERAVTWMSMLFVVLGALLGAVLAVAVESLARAHERRARRRR